MEIRFAKEDELERVNVLRKQVKMDFENKENS